MPQMTILQIQLIAPAIVAMGVFILTALISIRQFSTKWRQLLVRSVAVMTVLYIIAFLPYNKVHWLRSRPALVTIGICAVILIKVLSRLFGSSSSASV